MFDFVTPVVIIIYTLSASQLLIEMHHNNPNTWNKSYN